MVGSAGEGSASGSGGGPRRAGAEHEPPGQPQPAPFVVRCEAGKYAYCRCQRSARFPYCDGSHRRDPASEGPLKVVLDEDRIVAWCACTGSGSLPFCDGSHRRAAGR